MSSESAVAPFVRTWEVVPSRGYETSWIDLGETALSARGRAVGLTPEPYWVAYELETGEGFVTRRLHVTVETAAGTRTLDLRREDGGGGGAGGGGGGGAGGGRWTVDGVPRPDLDGALDCDLGLCPLTNTMPVLRHGLHRHAGDGPHEFVMAWVSVPDLAVTPVRQTYAHLARAGHGARVRYASGDFTADLDLDDHGLVLDYAGLAIALTR
ncbi:putative glycolipid-binding domain-containing protein [Streptomyces sp. NPDC101132]|uniref:putative glycolipid-binding domain-containing protein n=1 Tax=Streptomyces sp. NPDC101132 TaxID=3366110 RepID=UPI0037FD71E2